MRGAQSASSTSAGSMGVSGEVAASLGCDMLRDLLPEVPAGPAGRGGGEMVGLLLGLEGVGSDCVVSLCSLSQSSEQLFSWMCRSKWLQLLYLMPQCLH